MRRVVVVALIALAASPVRAQPRSLEIRVIDVAGGLAYLDRGERDGVVVGTSVTIASQRFVVVAASGGSAAVELGKQTVVLGARGLALITPSARPVEVARLPAPKPLGEFRGQWHPARRPATTQHPRDVPLGRAGAPAALRGALAARVELIEPDDGARVVTGWLGARVSADPLATPLGLDADGALMLWAGDGLAGLDAAHRRVRVRELRLRYGPAADPAIQLGRLRWTSSFGGPLDGVRVAAPVAGLALAAWGGGVPDEISGRPGTDAASFGAEASWSAPGHPLRPRVALAALGTTFERELDERKALATIALDGDRIAAGGHVELASFPGRDPWSSSSLELAALGVDARAAFGPRYLAAHVGARRPERSRRLAALLPLEWLCRPSPRPTGSAEPCGGAPLRSEAGVAAGWTGPRARLDAGVTGSHLAGADLAAEVTGFAALDLRALPLGAWLDLDLDAGRIDFVDWAGAGIGLSDALLDQRLEVGARYRATGLRYDASVAAVVEHRVGAHGALSLPTAELALDAELARGAGADALVALASAVWRIP